MRLIMAGRLLALCGALAVMPGAQAVGAVNAYMTIDGSAQGAFKGDSARMGATGGAIALTSVVRAPKDTASGMATGRRQHGTITIVREIDRASPMLAQALSTNESLRQVAITFQGAGAGAEKTKTAQKIVMTNVLITGIRKVGSSESITLDYETIEVTYISGGKTATDDWETPK